MPVSHGNFRLRGSASSTAASTRRVSLLGVRPNHCAADDAPRPRAARLAAGIGRRRLHPTGNPTCAVRTHHWPGEDNRIALRSRRCGASLSAPRATSPRPRTLCVRRAPSSSWFSTPRRTLHRRPPSGGRQRTKQMASWPATSSRVAGHALNTARFCFVAVPLRAAPSRRFGRRTCRVSRPAGAGPTVVAAQVSHQPCSGHRSATSGAIPAAGASGRCAFLCLHLCSLRVGAWRRSGGFSIDLGRSAIADQLRSFASCVLRGDPITPR